MPEGKLKENGGRSPRLWCVISTLRGDPILCLWVSESLCLIGTLLGRIVAYTFSPPLKRADPMHHRHLNKTSLVSSSSCRSFASRSLRVRRIVVHPETEQATTLHSRRDPLALRFCGCTTKSVVESIPISPPGSLHLIAAYSDEGVRAVRISSGDL